jgi:hypothetical protein
MANDDYNVMDDMWTDSDLTKAIEEAEKNGGRPDKLPDGTYEMRFIGMNLLESKNGNHGMGFAFTVANGDYSDTREYQNVYVNNVTKVDKKDTSPEAEYKSSPIETMAKGIAKLRRFLIGMQIFEDGTIPMFTHIRDQDWKDSEDIEVCEHILNEMDYSDVIFICEIKTNGSWRNFAIKDLAFDE